MAWERLRSMRTHPEPGSSSSHLSVSKQKVSGIDLGESTSARYKICVFMGRDHSLSVGTADGNPLSLQEHEAMPSPDGSSPVLHQPRRSDLYVWGVLPGTKAW